MANRWSESTFVTTEYLPGTAMDSAIYDAAALSKEKELPVRFKFNGMLITVQNLIETAEARKALGETE